MILPLRAVAQVVGWTKCKFCMPKNELAKLGVDLIMTWQRVLPQKDNFRPAVVLLIRKSGGNSGNRPPTAGNLCEIGVISAANFVMKIYASKRVVTEGMCIVATHARSKLCGPTKRSLRVPDALTVVKPVMDYASFRGAIQETFIIVEHAQRRGAVGLNRLVANLVN